MNESGTRSSLDRASILKTSRIRKESRRTKIATLSRTPLNPAAKDFRCSPTLAFFSPFLPVFTRARACV